MPGRPYDQDILLRSEQQADRLKRLAAGERVNDVDWLHPIDKIEALVDPNYARLRPVSSA